MTPIEIFMCVFLIVFFAMLWINHRVYVKRERSNKDDDYTGLSEVYVKKTALLVSELRVIADSFKSSYCRDTLIEAAQRLEDTDKIATFYRNKAEGNLNES